MPRLILVLLGTALSFSAYAAYAYAHRADVGAGFTLGSNKSIDRSGGSMKTADSTFPGPGRINVASIDNLKDSKPSTNTAGISSNTSSSNTDSIRTDPAARISEAAFKGFANLDFRLAQADRFADLTAGIWDTSVLPDDPENAAITESVLAGLMENANSPPTNLLATTVPTPSRQINAGGAFNGFGGFTNLSGFAAEPAPVPEPKIYALLLGGLGAVGFVAKRRSPI